MYVVFYPLLILTVNYNRNSRGEVRIGVELKKTLVLLQYADGMEFVGGGRGFARYQVLSPVWCLVLLRAVMGNSRTESSSGKEVMENYKSARE